jgi:hypothetical protein
MAQSVDVAPSAGVHWRVPVGASSHENFFPNLMLGGFLQMTAENGREALPWLYRPVGQSGTKLFALNGAFFVGWTN